MTDHLDVIAVHLAARALGARNLDDLYHSTFYAGVFPYDEWTHLGTRAAAEHRARDIRQSYRLPETAPVTMYTAWLRGRVYPHVLTDEQANDIWGTGYVREIDEGLPSGQGYHIFPYRNDSEAPGSISYLAHRSAIHVVRTESIPWHGPVIGQPGPAPSVMAGSTQVTVKSADKTEGAGDPRTRPSAEFPGAIATGGPAAPRRAVGQASRPLIRRVL